MSVIVLGGGITGLSCAYYFKKLGKGLIKKVILIERSTSLGGWVKSTRFPDGTVYEHGPRSIRVAGKSGFNTIQLVEELGLSSEVLPVTSSHVAAQRRLIWARNKLHVLPSSFQSIFRTQEPFSKPLAWFLMKDFLTRPKKQEDESIHDFAKRRLGDEVAEFLMDPMCRGVIAGNSREISVRSLLNTLYKAEQEHGSVIRGQLKYAQDNHLAAFLSSNLAVESKRDHWSLWSLKTGLQQLPEKLASCLDNDDQHGFVQTLINTACKKIYFESDKAMVHIEQDTVLKCDHIFSCLPARNLSRLVSMDQPSLAGHLSRISTVHVAVVNLEYAGNLMMEEGFGYLIPSTENSKILGTIFDSCCFPAHDGQYADKTRLTVMMGGYWFQSLFGSVDSVDPEVLLACAVQSVAEHLKITADPVRYHVSIQKNCIPQYKVGHHAIVESLRNEVEEKKLRLSLLGASYDGVSVNDCIYNARLEVERYLASLQV